MSAELEELELALEGELEWIRARRTKAAWPEVQARLGLEQKPIAFGGVTPEHVRAAVRLLARNAALRLEELQHRVERARASALWDRLARLADEEAERHRQASGARLGQVFANAAENVDFWKSQWDGAKNVLVLLCKTCGAPQEKTRDYRCGYCGGELFRRQEEEP